MMKRLLALFLAAAALLSAGLWWLLRRPAGGPADGATALPFAIQEVPSGWIIQHQDEQIPLRSFRWLPARGEGVLVAQILTQNDEQQVHLFKDGRLQGSWRLQRPPGLEEGFFRFAELRDACPLQDGSLLLLYSSGPAAGAGWLVDLDIRSGAQRWQVRVPGTLLAPLPDPKDPAVIVWGPTGNPLRVATTFTGKDPVPSPLELPAEIGDLSDLVALGATTLVLAHSKGLSVWTAGKGWTHHPLPAQPAFPAWSGASARLAKSPAGGWWQPCPGTLYELAADGAPLREVPLGLGSTEAALKEARMLHLLGCDRSGQLWFGLAAPILPTLPAAGDPAPLTAPEPAPDAPETVATTAGPSPEEVESWRQHLARGLGRLYRKPAGSAAFQRYDWSDLWKGWPEAGGLAVPQGSAGLRPEAGFLVFGSERRVWWLGLPALGGGTAVPAG